ncbi:hypothetical protein CYJ76_00020 [Kytococcus schroeteri]|uniref:Uncharacterized protein n=1 Tax=Kytococcus schroeteri TaxID=138300 RepID=A0A2I1PDJ3_9MICO|nr:hypothetical protein [Kytococcus schroeteri]PKZ42695.1 hypothetical protein CYJ76_00020 [Kytococcus schroeteri]
MLRGPVSWFLRQRLTGASAALWAAGLLTTVWVGSRDLPIPRLAPGLVQYAEFLPSLAAAGIVASMVAPRHRIPEVRSLRGVAAWERMGLAGALVLTCAVWVVAAVVGTESTLLVVASRDLLGYTGIGLVCRGLGWGPYAPAVCVLVAAAATVLGYPGQWLLHWPLEPVESWPAASIAVTLLCAGWWVGTGPCPMYSDATR